MYCRKSNSIFNKKFLMNAKNLSLIAQEYVQNLVTPCELNTQVIPEMIGTISPTATKNVERHIENLLKKSVNFNSYTTVNFEEKEQISSPQNTISRQNENGNRAMGQNLMKKINTIGRRVVLKKMKIDMNQYEKKFKDLKRQNYLYFSALIFKVDNQDRFEEFKTLFKEELNRLNQKLKEEKGFEDLKKRMMNALEKFQRQNPLQSYLQLYKTKKKGSQLKNRVLFDKLQEQSRIRQ